VHVAFIHDGGEVGNLEFVGRERKTKVSLREGGDFTPKRVGHGEGHSRRGFNGYESTLMVVYGHPSGSGKIIEKFFEVDNMLGDGTNNDEGIISVLEDRTC
jgi:hypothetical protein